MISAPLRDRFGMHFRLQFYTHEELAKIIELASLKLNFLSQKDASSETSRRSRGTPRIALRLLKRIRDYAMVEDEEEISLQRAKYALDELGVDDRGFDDMDIKFLELLLSARGRPMGLGTIGATLSEDEGTIEDVIEPYLIANGYVEKTSRGRIATVKCYEHFRLSPPVDKGSLID
jgi:Holliday junction DNA helicase RuvB